jgi:hypothetical protein
MGEESLVIKDIKSKKACPKCGQEMKLDWVNVGDLFSLDSATYPAFFEHYCVHCGCREASSVKVTIELGGPDETKREAV